MKFPFKWLKELSRTELKAREAANLLTMAGLEVESISSTETEFSGVVVGEVLDAAKIEGSSHLKVCRVSIGSEQLQIVCGADNVAAGQKVPVATIGAVLPGGLKIRKAKLRGVASEGMICSEAELGLSDEAAGIMVLNGDYPIGGPFQPAEKEVDTIIELSVTPNRPDCLGMLGIARELCVCEGRTLPPLPEYKLDYVDEREAYPIEILDPVGCPRYTARIIRDVKIGPSPPWLVERLHHAGVRNINNIVDVTNYIMLETGQPLHAFDLEKLQQGKIIVRNARAGETFVTLDGKEHTLNDENLLICDGSEPVALAGVMGGENSEVCETTRHILLESAYFSPRSVRKTSKQLGISSEAAKRFEKGVDPNGCAYASDAAASLIVQFAKGRVASRLLDCYPREIGPAQIAFRPNRANKIIGTDIPAAEARTILENLGCAVIEQKDGWLVRIPTHRPDLEREIDLIEEIARVYGFNNVPPTEVDRVHLYFTRNARDAFVSRVKLFAVQLGLHEVVTFSMVSAKSATPFIDESRLVRLVNPLSEDLAFMRPTLFSSVLPTVAHNLNRKLLDLRFFEIGSVFHKSAKGQIHESQSFCAVLTGHRIPASWEVPARAVSFFDAKGIAEALFAQFGLQDVVFAAATPAGCEFGAEIRMQGKVLGTLGKLDRAAREAFEIEREVFVLELNFEHFCELAHERDRFQPISSFPAVERDIAVVVDTGIEAQKIVSTIRARAGELLSDLRIFDVYQGKQIPAGKKSIGIAMKFQSLDRTLTDEEAEKIMQQIIRSLSSSFGASLRES